MFVSILVQENACGEQPYICLSVYWYKKMPVENSPSIKTTYMIRHTLALYPHITGLERKEVWQLE